MQWRYFTHRVVFHVPAATSPKPLQAQLQMAEKYVSPWKIIHFFKQLGFLFIWDLCHVQKNWIWVELENISKLPLSGFSCDTLVEAPLGNLKFISMATSLRTTDLLYSEYNTNISIVHFWNFYGTKFEFINTYGSFRQLIDIYIHSCLCSWLTNTIYQKKLKPRVHR